MNVTYVVRLHVLNKASIYNRRRLIANVQSLFSANDHRRVVLIYEPDAVAQKTSQDTKNSETAQFRSHSYSIFHSSILFYIVQVNETILSLVIYQRMYVN